MCLFAASLAASSALARHIDGDVRCDSNGNSELDGQDLPIVGAVVHITNIGGTFAVDATTDANGHYSARLQDDPDNYRAVLDAATIPPGATVLPDDEFVFGVDAATLQIFHDFLVQSDSCVLAGGGQCWMTGGGTQYDTLINEFVAEKGNKVCFGGNVHPGCSATAGSGGSWNHIDRARKLHFHGTDIPTVRCGNVPNIPPGSTSPKTPFNYIEYEGTGWTKGVQGNKADYPLVYFVARVEDRNEPGSNGAKDGALIDRYFLRVYLNQADPIGSTIILLDSNGGGSENFDVTPISTGNLQIHVSSCDDPPLQ